MYLFFFVREAMVTSVWQNPKIKNQGSGYNSTCGGNWDFIWKNVLLYSDFFLYIIRCICCTVGLYWMYSKYEWNQSDISIKLFNAYIYTDVTCICTQCYYFCISVKMLLWHCTCFKCSREITPASLMQLQHFIFTCLFQCKSAFFFLFPVYEINGNILYF